jgi:hypothetical protein
MINMHVIYYLIEQNRKGIWYLNNWKPQSGTVHGFGIFVKLHFLVLQIKTHQDRQRHTKNATLSTYITRMTSQFKPTFW